MKKSIKHIRELVTKGKVHNAFTHLFALNISKKDFLNNFQLLSCRFHRNEYRISKGIIRYDNASVSESQIIDALLKELTDFEEWLRKRRRRNAAASSRKKNCIFLNFFLSQNPTF